MERKQKNTRTDESMREREHRPPGYFQSGMERGEGPGMDETTGEGRRPEERGFGEAGGYVGELGAEEQEPGPSGGYGEPGGNIVEQSGFPVGGYREGDKEGLIGPDEELGGFEESVRRDGSRLSDEDREHLE